MFLTSTWYWSSVNEICSFGCLSIRREERCWHIYSLPSNPLCSRGLISGGDSWARYSACESVVPQCEMSWPTWIFTPHSASVAHPKWVGWVRETSHLWPLRAWLIHLLWQMSLNYLKLIAKCVEDMSLKALYCVQGFLWQPKNFCTWIKYVISNDPAG